MTLTKAAPWNPRRDFPSPADMGAPGHMTTWRASQQDAFMWASDLLARPAPRHIAMGLATGVGKSTVAYLLAHYASQGRTVILTSRLGLCDQYKQTFPDIAEVRGRRHYGSYESYRGAIETAQKSQVVVTTYAFWLATAGRGTGIPSLLICDEASEEFSELGNFMEVVLLRDDLTRLRFEVTRGWQQTLSLSWPDSPDRLETWAVWARHAVPEIERIRKVMREERHPDSWSRAEEETDEALMLMFSKLTLFLSDRAKSPPGEWVLEVLPVPYGGTHSPGVKVSCVWPATSANALLYLGVPRVVHMSATLRPKTMDLMGIPRDQYAFREWPHPFPAANRRVLWVPTIRAVEAQATADDWRTWVTRIDQVIEAAHRSAGATKGIVHTVSYRRAQMFMDESRNRDIDLFMAHGRENTASLVAQFRAEDPPKVLVSPVIISGWDIPEALYQVIGKLPFSPTSPLSLARRAVDPELDFYDVAQQVCQMSGRIVRGPGHAERGTTLIIDDSWSWFGWKYRNFFPGWFAVGKSEYVPQEF